MSGFALQATWSNAWWLPDFAYLAAFSVLTTGTVENSYGIGQTPAKWLLT
jgi:hypothetical protein